MGESQNGTESTEAAILRATDTALRKYGYEGLSMAKVAAEFDGSQSLIHYHFGNKEGLLAAYLADTRERFTASLDELPDEPSARLDRLIGERIGNVDDDDRLLGAYVGLHGAALDNDRIRAELAALDRALFEAFRTTVAEGIERGTFANRDPETVARLLVAGHDSAFLRVTLGESPATVRNALDRTIVADLRGDSAEESGGES